MGVGHGGTADVAWGLLACSCSSVTVSSGRGTASLLPFLSKSLGFWWVR